MPPRRVKPFATAAGSSRAAQENEDPLQFGELDVGDVGGAQDEEPSEGSMILETWMAKHTRKTNKESQAFKTEVNDMFSQAEEKVTKVDFASKRKLDKALGAVSAAINSNANPDLSQKFAQLEDVSNYMTDVCESFDDAALKIDALLEAANTEDILQHYNNREAVLSAYRRTTIKEHKRAQHERLKHHQAFIDGMQLISNFKAILESRKK